MTTDEMGMLLELACDKIIDLQNGKDDHSKGRLMDITRQLGTSPQKLFGKASLLRGRLALEPCSRSGASLLLVPGRPRFSNTEDPKAVPVTRSAIPLLED